jgi:hypothetical protein
MEDEEEKKVNKFQTGRDQEIKRRVRLHKEVFFCSLTKLVNLLITKMLQIISIEI